MQPICDDFSCTLLLPLILPGEQYAAMYLHLIAISIAITTIHYIYVCMYTHPTICSI